MIHVAVGLIICADKILIAERPANTLQGGLWEFPGGKVEPNESVFEGLRRELKEELNIQVIRATPFLKIPYHYSDRNIMLDVWKINQFEGEAIGAEGQLIRWIMFKDLNLYKFPEGNKLIIVSLLEDPSLRSG